MFSHIPYYEDATTTYQRARRSSTRGRGPSSFLLSTASHDAPAPAGLFGPSIRTLHLPILAFLDPHRR